MLYSILVTSSKYVTVLGIKLGDELFPKLYKLAVTDAERVKKVILMFKKHCLEAGGAGHIVELIEKSEPVKILGVAVDAISYPAIYCWYKINPADFERFFGETVERLWAGDRKMALKMTEDFLEKEIK